jgi:3-oxoacyl-[acyl-carrier-protein] synthase II
MAEAVAITGLGVVSPTGIGDRFAEALFSGAVAVKRIDLFDAETFACQIGAQLDAFSARTHVPRDYRKAVKVMARDIEIAVAAADLAVRDSGIVSRGIDPEATDISPKRLGCKVGAGLICTDLDELGLAVNTALVDGKFDLGKWGESGMANLTPLWLLKYLPNMLACHVTIIHGAEGPSNTITCGDASAHLAVGEAARTITTGQADAVIAGGAESKLNPMGLIRQALLRRLCITANDNPSEACRPFDAGHRGTVIGEGGGMLVLERRTRAAERGARVHAEIVGFGAACDPNGIDVTTPTAGGLEVAVARALADAGVPAEKVDLIAANGTGVPGEDVRECAAWCEALGGRAREIPAFAVTGAMGSLFAGAGGAQLAAAALALERQVVPPTANFAAPADGCGLDLSAEARTREMTYAVSGVFSIGGHSAAVVLKRSET